MEAISDSWAKDGVDNFDFLAESCRGFQELLALEAEFFGRYVFLEVPFERGNELYSEVFVRFILGENWYWLIVICDLVCLDECFKCGGVEVGFIGASSDGAFRDTQVHASPGVEFVEFMQLGLEGFDVVGNYSEVICICCCTFSGGGGFEGVSEIISV